MKESLFTSRPHRWPVCSDEAERNFTRLTKALNFLGDDAEMAIMQVSSADLSGLSRSVVSLQKTMEKLRCNDVTEYK